MDPNSLSLILFFLLALALACAPFLASWLMSVLRRGDRAWAPAKARPLGFGGRFRVPFFLLAVLFLIFEMGALIILPWALAFGWALGTGAQASVFFHLVVFMVLFALAVIFAVGSRALNWEG